MKKILLHLSLITILSIFTAYTPYAQIITLKGERLRSRAIERFIKIQMDSLKIPALSITIVEHGKVVYYYASGVINSKGEKLNTNTLFEAASMTKPVFAYAVHKLIKRNILNIDTPLYRYYPYKDIDYDNRYKLITARMVLSHTTGFPNWRPEGSKLTINADPGSNYGYSGEGYEYLGKVVSHLAGKNLQDIIQDEVFAPFFINRAYMIKSDSYVREHLADGLKDNKDWGKNRISSQSVASSLCTESREYAKFLIGLINETSYSNSIFQAMSISQLSVGQDKSICLGIFSEQTPFGIKYSHSGNNNNRYNSNFEFYKDLKIGYVFFMNCHKELQFTKRLNEFLINGK